MDNGRNVKLFIGIKAESAKNSARKLGKEWRWATINSHLNVIRGRHFEVVIIEESRYLYEFRHKEISAMIHELRLRMEEGCEDRILML